MTGVIDRFEGGWVLVEIVGETELRNIQRKLLPDNTKEGNYLKIELGNGQIIRVEIEVDATQIASERIQDKLKRLQRGEHLNNDQ